MLMDCACARERRPSNSPAEAAADDTWTDSASDTIITSNRDAIDQPGDGKTPQFYDATDGRDLLGYATVGPFAPVICPSSF